MKISEVTMPMLCLQLRENAEALSEEETAYIEELKKASIHFIQQYTGINGIDEEDENGRKLDDYEDLTYVLLATVSHMYDNREMTVSTDKMNPIATSILNMHTFTLVPKEDEA